MADSGLGLLLRNLRDQRGLSLRELAQLAGIDHAYIYRLETGAKESPSDEVLTKLIRALKAGKREADMVRFLAKHAETDAALVDEVFKDSSIPYEVFAAAAGAAFRGGPRRDYKALINSIRRIFDEENRRG